MNDRRLRPDPIMALWLVGLAGLTSCQNDISEQRHTSSGSKSIIATVKENASGRFITQMDTATNNRVAQVQIPKGALAIDQQITVTASHHTDPSDLKAEFSISEDNTIIETQVATVVSSNVDKNLNQPMTIALDLPESGASLFGLTWQKRHFFVVYTVRDASLNIWKRGIMPDSALTIKDGRVLFQSQLMGRYELFESVAPLKVKSKEKVVAKPDFKHPPVAITRVSPIIADYGETVTLHGKYLSENTKVYVGEREINDPFFHKVRGTVSFTLPKIGYGPATVVIKDGKRSDRRVFFVHEKKAGTPIFADVEPSAICQGITFMDGTGQPWQGAKKCLAACEMDNQAECRATDDYPAFAHSKIDRDKMLRSMTVQRVKGKADLPKSRFACKDEWGKGCRIEGEFMALKDGSLIAEVVKKGIRPPRYFMYNQETEGAYPSSRNQLDGFDPRAYELTPERFREFASRPKGTPIQYADTSGKVHILEAEGSLTPDSVVPGAVIFGVRGKGLGSIVCAESGETDCMLKGQMVSVAKDKLAAGNIKKGAKVGIVQGSYPSAKTPLEGAGGAGPWLKGDFKAAITSNKEFSYFNSAGEKITSRGSPGLKASQIEDGVTIFGVSGTMKKFDRDVFKPENIRYDVKINDVTGKLQTGCRNMANLDEADRQSAPGKDGLDPFDTITDTTMPSENPWPDHPEYLCTADIWQDMKPSGCKNKINPSCVFKNKSTNRLWAGYNPAKMTNFASAKSHCESGKWGGDKIMKGQKWRLATAKELLQASLYGLVYLRKKYGNDKGRHSNPYFASSTKAKDPAKNIAVDIRTGRSTLSSATTETPVICTLPLAPGA